MKKILILLFIIFSFGKTKAQENSFLKVYDHKKLTANTLKIYAEDGLISLSVIKPNLIEVAFLKEDIASEQTKQNTKEQSYIRVTQNLENVYLQTDSLMLVISKLDFSIHFKSYKGQTFLVTDSAQNSNQFSALNFRAAKESIFTNLKGKSMKVKDYTLKGKSFCLINEPFSIKIEETVKGNLDFKRSNQFQFKTNNSSALVFQFCMGVVK